MQLSPIMFGDVLKTIFGRFSPSNRKDAETVSADAEAFPTVLRTRSEAIIVHDIRKAAFDFENMNNATRNAYAHALRDFTASDRRDTGVKEIANIALTLFNDGNSDKHIPRLEKAIQAWESANQNKPPISKPASLSR